MRRSRAMARLWSRRQVAQRTRVLSPVAQQYRAEGVNAATLIAQAVAAWRAGLIRTGCCHDNRDFLAMGRSLEVLVRHGHLREDAHGGSCRDSGTRVAPTAVMPAPAHEA